LWTPVRGMRRLPPLNQLGLDEFGVAQDINEFGQIVGTTFTATTSERATLWTPIAGPLVVAPTDEGAAPEVGTAPVQPRVAGTALCALGRKLGDWSRLGIIPSRACFAR
jgi:hypothetical protein